MESVYLAVYLLSVSDRSLRFMILFLFVSFSLFAAIRFVFIWPFLVCIVYHLSGLAFSTVVVEASCQVASLNRWCNQLRNGAE